MLDEYKKLLRDYHQEISSEGWEDRIPPLIQQMNRIWNKIDRNVQNEALNYSEELYQARIK